MPVTKHDLDELEARLNKRLDKIMATEQDVVAALQKIDAATTKIAANVQGEANTIQTISDEIDALISKLSNAGVSQALLDEATALAEKTQAASDALDAQVPVLQAIATKGANNPVPVPVP